MYESRRDRIDGVSLRMNPPVNSSIPSLLIRDKWFFLDTRLAISSTNSKPGEGVFSAIWITIIGSPILHFASKVPVFINVPAKATQRHNGLPRDAKVDKLASTKAVDHSCAGVLEYEVAVLAEDG